MLYEMDRTIRFFFILYESSIRDRLYIVICFVFQMGNVLNPEETSGQAMLILKTLHIGNIPNGAFKQQ